MTQMAQVYAYYFDKEIFFKYLKFIVVVNYLNFCYYKIEIKMKHKKMKNYYNSFK